MIMSTTMKNQLVLDKMPEIGMALEEEMDVRMKRTQTYQRTIRLYQVHLRQDPQVHLRQDHQHLRHLPEEDEDGL
jgi:hypothetical protein